MTIAITTSGIALDGPLVAGEKVAVSVSGLSLAAEDRPTLALLARFPDALLASVELAESETAGTWTGELDTATKQTALFFATARADERRDAALELVSGRVSLARLTVPMANSALCPKPDGSPFASPVYVPVPGPPGQGGDPYDQAPAMDGEASPGTADEYARGDHRHPTDTTRQAVIADLAAIRSGAAAGATAVQPAALAAVATTGDYADLTNKPTIPAAQIQSDWDQTNSAAVDYIKNKPTIPGPAPVTSVNGETGDVAIYGNTLIMAQGQSTLVSTAITNAQSDATRALNELPFKASATSIAPAFSTSSTYAVGDYCTYEGLLYKCTTAVSTAGAWDAANWTAVAVTNEMGGGGAPKNVWYVGSTTGAGGTISGSTTTGDFVLAEGNVVVVKMSFGVNATSATLNIDGTGAKSISTRSGTTTFPQYFWSNGQAIAFVYDGTCYIPCGMAPATIYNTWGLTSLSSTVSNDETKAATPKAVNTRAPKDSPAFTGTPTAPTAAAGTNTTQVATTAFVQTSLRYSLPAAISVTAATSTAALQDRAVNTVSVGAAVTTLNLTFPAAVSGYARDFFLRLDCAGTALATIALPSGETVDFGADALAGLTGKAGVHLALFTEVAANHWLISAREAEA